MGGGGGAAAAPLHLEASAEDAGLRLDAFLAARGAAASRSAAQRLIDSGAVLVDGAPRPKNHRVAAGQVISIEAEAGASSRRETLPELEVVYEDADLLVVDKPAGLVTHPAPGHRGPTLAEALSGRAAGGPDPERAGIVHRLDRDTSGLLAVAKTEEAHAALSDQLRAREVKREYLALVAGHPEAESGTIDAPIGRDRARRTVVSTRSDRPRAAVTRFEVIERLPATTLLRVNLETGRTHQIRAHLAAIGHPVCGDSQYGGRACGRELGLERQFLHAQRLMFRHPRTGEIVVCESKPPVDLRRALDAARREQVSGGPDGD
ncbi:MAG: RluA family pseudouridine synthase [Thermoleophilaceae bacterium]|nr:RluA family pseudouridine synthase [Thermoleophilaceae bacterium]